MSTQTFQIIPQVEFDRMKEVGELYWSFGDGYDAQAFVGHTSGTRRFSFSYIIPKRTTHQVTDPEDSNVKTYAQYVEDFWLARKLDGAEFNVTDPLSGSTVTVKFIDRTMSMKHVTKTVYRISFELMEHRSS